MFVIRTDVDEIIGSVTKLGGIPYDQFMERYGSFGRILIDKNILQVKEGIVVYEKKEEEMGVKIFTPEFPEEQIEYPQLSAQTKEGLSESLILVEVFFYRIKLKLNHIKSGIRKMEKMELVYVDLMLTSSSYVSEMFNLESIEDKIESLAKSVAKPEEYLNVYRQLMGYTAWMEKSKDIVFSGIKKLSELEERLDILDDMADEIEEIKDEARRFAILNLLWRSIAKKVGISLERKLEERKKVVSALIQEWFGEEALERIKKFQRKEE